MAIADKLLLRIDLDVAELRKGLNQANKRLDNFNKTTQKGGTSFLKMAAAMATGTIAAQALRGAIRALNRAFKETVSAAAENEIAVRKFDVVFKGVIDTANKFREELVEGFSLSSTQATIFLSQIQDLLVPMGIARRRATELSGEFVKLATNLAIFTPGATVEQGLLAISSALTGMFLPLRRLGAALSVDDIEARAFIKGLDPKKLTQAQKAILILELATERSSDAMGAVTKNADTFAEASRRLASRMDDLVNALGDPLLDVLVVFTNKSKETVEIVNEWVKANERLIKVKLIEFLQDFIKVSIGTIERIADLTVGVIGLAAGFLSIVKVAAQAQELTSRFLSRFSEEAKEVNEANKQALRDIERQFVEMGNAIEDVNKLVLRFKKNANDLTAALQEAAAVTFAPAVDSVTFALEEMAIQLESMEKGFLFDPERQQEIVDQMILFTQEIDNQNESLINLVAAYNKLGISAPLALKKVEKEIETIGKSFNVGNAIAQQMASGISSAFQTIAKEGKISANELGASLLGALGTIATQMGGFAIAAGITMLALAGLSPAQAIVAGIALVAIGGLLTGLASNMGGGAQTAPTGGAVGGGGGGGVVGGEFAPTEIVEEQEPVGQVQIIIQGADAVPRDEWERIVQQFILPAIRRVSEEQNVVTVSGLT